MTAKVQSFLAQFQGWAHWLAGLLATAWTVYAFNPQVHEAVNNAIAHNKKLAGFFAVIGPIVTAYLNSKKAQ